MKIAILVPNFTGFDGGARVAQQQAEDLAREGNDVTVFAFASDIQTPNIKQRIIGMPANLLGQRVYRLLFPLDVVKTIRWVRELKHFDMVIAHLYPLTWLGYLAKRVYKIKYVFWYHGEPFPHLFPHWYERVYIRLGIFLLKITIRNTDRAVAVSQYARAELKAYTGLDAEVIYNKVDRERFHPGIDGSGIRDKHNLNQDPVILSVGRVCPQKGFHLLIQSFGLVRQQIPRARLVIVGKEDYDYYSKQLRKMSDASVIFAGYVGDDVRRYYAMCDVYATGSLWETYNLPLVEAQLCGKPVVAFNMGPHPEVIDKNGILVETGDIVKLAEACTLKLRQVCGQERLS